MYKDLIDGSTRVIFIFNIISKRALLNRHNDKNVIAFSKNMIANLKLERGWTLHGTASENEKATERNEIKFEEYIKIVHGPIYSMLDN